MIQIEKHYHFYAAHRNHELPKGDKCRSLHGHTYEVTVVLGFKPDFEKNAGITMLFGDIDKIIEPIIKKFDHALLLSKDDKLIPYLSDFENDEDESLKIVFFNNATSCENIAENLYDAMLIHFTAHLLAVKVKETQTSEVIFV